MVGEILEFRKVRFKPQNGWLEVAGETVELDRSSIAVLATLLEEAGSDVGKERLLEAGWPGRIVQENSLTKAISRLRSVLGEDGAALKTVHGYGYCLDAAVTRSLEEPETSAAEPAQTGRSRSLLVAIAALVGVLVVGGAVALSSASDPAEPIVQSEAPDVIGRVLWVDDNPTNNATERRLLVGNGIAVHQVTSTQEAMQQLETYEYDAVISDMGRDGNRSAGIDLLKQMRARESDVPFILYTFEVTPELLTLIGSEGGQAVTAKRADLYGAIFPLFDLAPPES